MLKTDRLLIREITLSDLESIHSLHLLPETDQYNTLGIPENINETEHHVQEWVSKNNELPRVKYVLAIELLESNQFIGLFGINIGKEKYKNAEIWYKIHKDYWNKGYTTEAVKRVLSFGFNELNLHRIEAGCATENIASIRVLEKVGMFREGMKRKNLPIRGAWKDNYFYGILKEEFKSK